MCIVVPNGRNEFNSNVMKRFRRRNWTIWYQVRCFILIVYIVSRKIRKKAASNVIKII